MTYDEAFKMQATLPAAMRAAEAAGDLKEYFRLEDLWEQSGEVLFKQSTPQRVR